MNKLDILMLRLERGLWNALARMPPDNGTGKIDEIADVQWCYTRSHQRWAQRQLDHNTKCKPEDVPQ